MWVPAATPLNPLVFSLLHIPARLKKNVAMRGGAQDTLRGEVVRLGAMSNETRYLKRRLPMLLKHGNVRAGELQFEPTPQSRSPYRESNDTGSFQSASVHLERWTITWTIDCRRLCAIIQGPDHPDVPFMIAIPPHK